MKLKKILITLRNIIYKKTFLKSLSHIKSRFLESYLQSLYRFYLSNKAKLSQKIINSPYQSVWIPPELIKYKSHPDEIQVGERLYGRKKIFDFEVFPKGLIIGGDWDEILNLNKKSIKTTPRYVGLKQRFEYGFKWEKTAYYKGYYENYNKDKKFVHYKKNYQKLYKNIKKQGFKSQEELGQSPARNIVVHITRNGKIIKSYGEGNHRLSIAKFLSVSKVPVIVTAWHKQYIDWVKENTDIDKITPKTAIQPILDGRAEVIR